MFKLGKPFPWKTLAFGLLLLQACTLSIRPGVQKNTDKTGPDTTPPNAATSLSWQESSPHGSLSVHADWTHSTSTDVATQKIQFFSDGTCSAASGSQITLPLATTESYLWGAPTSGTYSYQITSIDAAANSTTSACSSAMVISTAAPDNATVLSWVQTSPFNSTSVTASWVKSGSANLANQKIQFYSDGVCGVASGSEIDLASTAAQTYAWTAPAQGTYSYTITSVNSLALTSTSSCSTAMVIDTTPPSLAITSPTPASYINIANVSSFPVAGTCSENTRTVTIGGSAAAATPTCTANAWTVNADFTAAAQGSVALTADHTDLAGNNATQATRAFFKDTVAPSVALTAPNGGQLFGGNTSQSITWTATDVNGIAANSVTLEYTTDGTNWTSIATGEANDGTYSWTTPTINSATIRVRVTAVDVAGNSTADSSDAVFEIDSTTPNLAAATVANQSPTSIRRFYLVYGTITDTYTDYCIQEVSTVGTCSWTAGPLPAYYEVTGVNAAKTLSIWIRDALGNVSTRVDTNVVTYNNNLNLTPASFTAALSNTTTNIDAAPNGAYTVTGNDGKIYLFGGFWDTTTTTGNLHSINKVWSYDPTTEQIESLPPMSERRYNFEGTKLSDGRIWVGGGLRWTTGGFVYTKGCEIFNPATKKWGHCRNLPVDLYRFSAVTVSVADGSERVAVIGGKLDLATTVGTIYLYDPRHDTWSNGPTMAVTRSNAVTAKLPDGRVYVGNGISGSTDLFSYGFYNPVANTWTAGANSAPNEHFDTDAIYVSAADSGLAYDSLVIFGGGFGTNMDPNSAVSLLRLDTGAWLNRATMSSIVGHARVIKLPGDQILRVGGLTTLANHTATVQRYDVSANTWTARTSIPVTRGHHRVHEIPGNKLVVLGGNLASWNETMPKNYVYDITGDSWSETGHFFIQSDAFAVEKLNNGKVLKCGGYSTLATAVLRDCFTFNPATSAWDTVGKMSTARQNFHMVKLPDGKVLATGGRTDNAATSTNTAEIFDPATGTWSAAASFTSARRYHRTILLADNDTVLLVGGDNGNHSTYYPNCFKYSISGNSWSAAGTLASGRTNFAMVRLNDNNVFVTNGFDGTISLYSSEIYNVGTNTWSTVASSSDNHGAPAFFHTGTGASERVYISGGFTSGGGAGTGVTEYYDVTTNTWTTRANMPSGRWATGTALAADGFFYVFGGVTGGVIPGTATNLVHRYNISGDSWTAITNLNSNATSNLYGNVFNAMLLDDGRVLIPGNGGGVRSSELYSFVTTQTFTATGGELNYTRSLTSGLGTFYSSTGLYVPQSSTFTSRGGSGTSGVITVTDGYINTDTSTFTVP